MKIGISLRVYYLGLTLEAAPLTARRSRGLIKQQENEERCRLAPKIIKGQVEIWLGLWQGLDLVLEME